MDWLFITVEQALELQIWHNFLLILIFFAIVFTVR